MNRKKHYASTNVMKLLTIDEAKERYKVGRGLLTQIAKENNALLKIGRCVRIDAEKLDSALEIYEA